MRWNSAIGVLILVAAPATAIAKDRSQEHLQSVVACGSIAESEARLRCFDQSVLAVKEALEQGRLVVEENKGPRALGGIVRASGSRGENRYWVELENGDRWLLLPTTSRDEPPRPGAAVKLRKGGLLSSGYWISADGWQESRADFLGN